VQTGCFLYSSHNTGLNAVHTVRISLETPSLPGRSRWKRSLHSSMSNSRTPQTDGTCQQQDVGSSLISTNNAATNTTEHSTVQDMAMWWSLVYHLWQVDWNTWNFAPPHHKTFTQFTFVQAAQLLLTKHKILNKTQANNLLFTSANNLPAFTTSSHPHATLLSYLGSQLAHLSHAKPPVLKTLHLHYVRVKSSPNKITN